MHIPLSIYKFIIPLLKVYFQKGGIFVTVICEIKYFSSFFQIYMKTLSRYAIALAAIVFCSLSANAQRQSKLYIDDGTGNFTTLTVPHGSGGGIITLPTGTGALSYSGLSHITESYNNSVAPYAAGIAGEQLLASGTDAAISIALQPKGTGALEAQIADGTIAGGNKRGTNAVDWQTVRIANTQVASGNLSTISGGQDNTASGFRASTVSGGETNAATGTDATVSGGTINTASNQGASVSGGVFNTASGTLSTISGGANNVASGTGSSVGGGGQDNFTGFGNVAQGDASTIAGGLGNFASGSKATISGGYGADASQYGQSAHASGYFTTRGDAQTSVFTVRNSTTDATATNLLLDGQGGTNNLTTTNNSSWIYHVLLVARQSSGTASDAWDMTGLAVNNGGTLTLTPGTTTHIGATAWTVTAVVSGTSLEIQVTGAAATTIQWMARVETAETTF